MTTEVTWREYYADVEETEYSDSDDDNGSKAESNKKDFFSFGNSITIQGRSDHVIVKVELIC
jgi:hypothetical protein